MRSYKRLGGFFAVATAALLPACSSASVGGGPAPDRALSMRMPSSASAQVIRSDTSLISVNTGIMGTIEMTVEDQGTIDLAFASDPAGVQVTANYSEFVGEMSNPMAGNITADESDIGGQLVFTLDDRAHATVQEGFEVKMEVAQMVGSKTLAYDLFPRFSTGSLTAGQSWVDTVAVEEEGEFTASTTTITTYSIVGDTVVNGRSLLRLNTSSEVELSSMGEQQGLGAMSQSLTGTSQGWMLWDRDASMTHSAFSESQMEGVVSVDMAGVPDMALSVSGRQHTRTVY